jgi:hypothetical protein
MAKKKNTEVLSDAEKQAQQRLMAIRQFNMNNEAGAYIDPNRVPTEEEIADAKKAFEDRTAALQKKDDYLIADVENSLRVAKFLKKFVENGFWTQRYFVGVINFTDYITKFIEEAEKEPKELTMEYGPMQFVFLMMENYAGFGLDAAKKFAEIWDEYVPIYDTLRDHIEWYRTETEEIKKLQQRWGMLAQGYYITYPDPDASTVSNTEQSTTETSES